MTTPGRCPTCGRPEPTKEPLTEAQEHVLLMIRAFHGTHHRFPTYSQLGEWMGGRALSTISEHVHHLHDKGYLTLDTSYHGPAIVAVMEP